MTFTDTFIHRPVLAWVVSLFILLLGLRAILELPLRQYPRLESAVITVTTTYAGASADLIQGFITTPLQQAVADAEGIDYLTSESRESLSTIKAFIELGYDSNNALTEIMSKVAQVRDRLPAASEDPVIQRATGGSTALMYVSFFSAEMSPEQITDYLTRVVQPRLETVPGVAEAKLFGERTYAMRVWLDPHKMAALGVTPGDATKALKANNYQAAAGRTKGEFVTADITAHTDLNSVAAFRRLVVRSDAKSLVRLEDIARVELGAESYDMQVTLEGQQAIFIGIAVTPGANPLQVIGAVRAELPQIEQQLPHPLKLLIVQDATVYIKAAMREVLETLAEACLIVVVVIFLFLGSVREVVVPVVSIPLSMIGAAFFMLVLGYSLNLLTLLAMVLAVGLVVDDAIIVVENVYRYRHEEGLSATRAAVRGAREIAMPVVAMTFTLAAVYAPMGFTGGLTGSLFREFAFTLAATVVISGVIALTLSPMLCSKLLRAPRSQGRLGRRVGTLFGGLKNAYTRRLRGVLDYPLVTVVFALAILTSCYFLYATSKQELAPTEDQGTLFTVAQAPEYANLDYVMAFTREFPSFYDTIPEIVEYHVIDGMGSVNRAWAGVSLKPWNERERSQAQIQTELQHKLDQVAGLQTAVFPPPSLPGSHGLPFQFVVNATTDYEPLYRVSETLLEQARASGLFASINSDLRFDRPQLQLRVKRDLAAQLGITLEDIGTALGTMLGGDYVNRFSWHGRSYKVIPQVPRQFRSNPDLLRHYHIRTASGALVPLATVVTLDHTVQPSVLNQFQQLNAATLQGVLAAGVTEGQALAFLQRQADQTFPAGFGSDYGGGLRRYTQEGNTLVYAFLFALLVIYLVLAAQFESFRDPLVILISVPMSLCGALIPLNLGFATINIYTQIGLITLVGLISKHGILMVEFANQLQRSEGLSPRLAMEKAAAIRLRPVLMTTVAMVAGVIPLLLASGAGAASRFSIGLVIGSGMTVGTLFTLFVVPVMYTLMAERRRNGAHSVSDMDSGGGNPLSPESGHSRRRG